MSRIEYLVKERKVEMLQLLQRLVNIDSGSDYPDGVNQVRAILQTEYEQMGFAVRILPGKDYADHLLAEYGSGEPSVLLIGHMDTVFPVGTVTRRPFALDERKGKAFGPGVLDMKSGLVIMLYAIKALLHDRLEAHSGSIRVFLNSDEEPGSRESREYLPQCLRDVRWALSFEPSSPDGAITTQRKGVGVYWFTVRGKAAHAGANPADGANAIEQLMHVLIELTHCANTEKGTSVNVGSIEGGEKPYIVPELARATLDLRVASMSELERMQQCVARAASSCYVEGTKTVAEGGFHRPPMVAVPRLELMKEAVVSAARNLDFPVHFSESPRGGASDANLIVALGFPCLDGMGAVGAGAHTDSEFIELPSLYEKTSLVVLLLRSLLGWQREGTD